MGSSEHMLIRIRLNRDQPSRDGLVSKDFIGAKLHATWNKFTYRTVLGKSTLL